MNDDDDDDDDDDDNAGYIFQHGIHCHYLVI
jgi:hypothetical protein